MELIFKELFSFILSNMIEFQLYKIITHVQVNNNFFLEIMPSKYNQLYIVNNEKIGRWGWIKKFTFMKKKWISA